MTKAEAEDWIDRWAINHRSVCGACSNRMQKFVRASHGTMAHELYYEDKEELVMLIGELVNAPWALTAERAEDELGW